MTKSSDWLQQRFYKNDEHPYRLFEAKVQELVQPSTATILDAGCGRTAPVLRKLASPSRRLIGIDLVDPSNVPPGIEYHKADLAKMPLEDESVDLVISRSVFEHLEFPQDVYRELNRVLKPGGQVVFLTASLYDYGTVVSRMVPNVYHSKVVKAVEGRDEHDTFPTMYRTNDKSTIEKLSSSVGMKIQSIDYLNQYPNYFKFNAILYALGIVYERITTRFDALKTLRGWILVTLVKKA